MLGNDINPYHKIWLGAAEAKRPVGLDFPTKAAAVAYRMQLYRWRKRNAAILTDDIIAMSITILENLDGYTLKITQGVTEATLREL